VGVSLFLSGSRLALYAITLAVLVGFARIFVGVHFSSDMLAGAGPGAVIALLIHVGGKWVDRAADVIYLAQTRILRRR